MSSIVDFSMKRYIARQVFEAEELQSNNIFHSSSDFNNDISDNNIDKSQNNFSRNLMSRFSPSNRMCTANEGDTLCNNANNGVIPPRTFVVTGHGNGVNGVLQGVGFRSDNYEFVDKRHFLSPQQLASDIKRSAGNQWSGIKQIVIQSCDVARAWGGKYCQDLANILGKDVWAASDGLFIAPDGRVSVYQPIPDSSRPLMNRLNPGRFILFRPEGDIYNNTELQSALSEKILSRVVL
jgi:hypothetical protein